VQSRCKKGAPRCCLCTVNGRLLIASVIEAQAAAGVTEIAIVVGYLGDRVAEALGDGRRFGVRLHYLRNADYLGGNAVSVHRAREWADGSVVVWVTGGKSWKEGMN